MNDKPGEKLNNSKKIEQQDHLPETPMDTKTPDPESEDDLKGKELFEEDDNPKNDPENVVPENEERELFAANFEPFEALENQVGEVFRSEDAEISGPTNGVRFNIGQTIQLEWKTEDEAPLSVKIFDNRNNQILNRENAKSPYTIGSLKPGLYYWKLETDDDLIHVGKFFVDRIE